MSKILLWSILIASITSFNWLAYAADDFTPLNLEAYNKALDEMYDTLEKLKNISDTYEIQLHRVQNILRETTDIRTKYDLRWVIYEYQTYLNELDNLKFNLDNNITALGEIARELPPDTLTIRVPRDFIKVPSIPRPLPSLPILPEAFATARPSVAVGNHQTLQAAARADQEATRLAAGEERLRFLERQTRMESARERARELAARRTEKITDSFFDEIGKLGRESQSQLAQKIPSKIAERLGWLRRLFGFGAYVATEGLSALQMHADDSANFLTKELQLDDALPYLKKTKDRACQKLENKFNIFMADLDVYQLKVREYNLIFARRQKESSKQQSFRIADPAYSDDIILNIPKMSDKELSQFIFDTSPDLQKSWQDIQALERRIQIRNREAQQLINQCGAAQGELSGTKAALGAIQGAIDLFGSRAYMNTPDWMGWEWMRRNMYGQQ